MKTKDVLVMKVEVQIDEDGNMCGARVTTTRPENPRKRTARQFENIEHAFDDILNDLLRMKFREIAEDQAIHSHVGNA